MTVTKQLSIVTIDPQRYPTTQYKLIRELGREEYDEYKRAKQRLSRFVEDQEKIKLLRETYSEYRSVIESIAARSEVRERPMSVVEVHTQDLRSYHQVNSRLRALLSEMTTFLNYAEGYLKREYGHDSDEVKKYKARTAKEYDTSPSYRFVYQLRNYALHYDVPINGMTVESGERNPATGAVKKVVRVEIDRDKLLNSGFDWKKVRPDIEAFPPRFPLDAHLDHMVKAIGRINVAVIVAMLPDMMKGARYIDDLVRPLIPHFGGLQGSPVIVDWQPPPSNVKVGEPFNMNVSTEMIPADLATYILGLPEPDMLAAAIDEI